MRKQIIILLIIAVAILSCNKSVQIRNDFEKYFSEFNVQGAFILYDMQKNCYVKYNETRCKQQFLPASTFKILNSLIGLETGIIADENFEIKWDSTHPSVKSWNRDHTLKSAVKYSAVWYFMELAKRVGKEKIQRYVDKCNYGNMDISGTSETFWLNGNLKISPDQQITFLKQFYNNDLPFSKRSLDIVKEILLFEETSEYKIRAKTGWAIFDKQHIGWFIGYIEKENNIYFFVTNIENKDSDIKLFLKARIEITKNILKNLNIL